MKEPSEKFICEQIKPVPGTYDASAMSIGEPGFPGRFIWRKQEYFLAEILEKWKDTSNCRHGGSEKYVRKHWYKIRTACGLIMKIYFERQVKPGASKKKRWWLNTIEKAEGVDLTRVATRAKEPE
jgi:hypothetical protein